MQRLEKELEKFKDDIKHREKENERLREQITSLRYQIQHSNKLLKDVSQVSDVQHRHYHDGISLRPMRSYYSRFCCI